MCSNNDCTDTSQITIPNGATGAAGTNGTNGADGADGSDGIFGGFSGAWLFNSTTSSGPATTTLRFNDTVLANVTKLYVHNNNSASTDFSAFLAATANTSSGNNHYGLIRVFKETDSNTFFYGKVTASVVNGSTREITVTHIQSNGTFSNTNSVVVSFTPSGENATYDKEVLYTDNTPYTSNSGTYVTYMTRTIPADTLVNVGDVLNIKTVGAIANTAHPKAKAEFDVTIAGTSILPNVSFPWTVGMQVDKVLVEVELTMVSASQVFMEMKSFYLNYNQSMITSYGAGKLISFTSSGANIVLIKGRNYVTGTNSKAEHLLIKKFNI